MVDTNHRVVILLATLNGAQFLAEQLQSYCDQTHQDWELVVSDDGSSDSTVKLLEEFAKSVPQHPVTLLDGPRRGYGQNFLSLVQRCPGGAEFFAFSDQDDIWSAQKLERAVARLNDVPAGVPAVYFTRTMSIGKNGGYLGLSPLYLKPPSFQNALVQNIGGGNTMVFNRAARSLLLQALDTSVPSHDWWTYQVVTGVGGVAYYDAWPSLKYRQHGANVMGSKAGLLAGMSRAWALFRGQFSGWSARNVEALTGIKSSLTPANATTLDFFARSRSAAFPKRLYLIWKSKVYRQHYLENIGLYVASAFNKV